LTITRRQLLDRVGALALAGSGLVGAWIVPAWAQRRSPPPGPATVSTEELMQPGPLKEETLGSPTAPVTIVEYASMTCSHCADFHVKTFPELKKRYIDTGKVFFVFREFPLDPLAAGAFMLARCADGSRYFDLIDVLFHQQKQWAFARQPLEPLFGIVKQAGFTEQSFRACLSNQKLLESIEQVRDRAANKFGVNSTPTFFINGTRQVGAISIETLEKLLEPYLKS
jgi:protein-disulfide isomerase